MIIRYGRDEDEFEEVVIGLKGNGNPEDRAGSPEIKKGRKALKYLPVPPSVEILSINTKLF